jgi:hypothetical protein
VTFQGLREWTSRRFGTGPAPETGGND